MSDKPMKLMWHSNAIHVGSGYGVQSKLFVQKALEEGWDVIHGAFFGLQGAVIDNGQLTILPGGYENHGADVLQADLVHYKPDVAVVLYDSWVYPANALDGWTSYAPIDAQPAPKKVIQSLHSASYVWSMSRFGQKEMRAHSIINDYVPHGVDCDIYTPSAELRQRFRSRYGWDDDTLVVMTVAANKGAEDRKNLRQLIKAWCVWREQKPDIKAVLYIHSNPFAVHSGVDFQEIIEFYGDDESIVYPDGYGLVRDRFPQNVMNGLYNAADLFILPSGGEGFGVPIIEAQAAGLPVAVTNFTAMSELGEAGHLIPVDVVDDLYYNAQGTEWARPKVSNIIKAFEWGKSIKGNKKLRDQAREFAMNYEIGRVWETYAKPAILKQVEQKRTIKEERELRRSQFERMLRQKTAPPPVKQCTVCDKEYFGMDDTCSIECQFIKQQKSELLSSLVEVSNGSD